MDDEELAYLPEVYHKCIENQTEKIFKTITKGGKKVRPYLETKVVKVKKEKKNNNLCSPFCSWNGFCIHQKKRIGKKKCIVSGNKGNWVNGENLDKIKFPCFCSYEISNVVYGYGEVIISFKKNDQVYELINIDGQTLQGTNKVAYFNSLRELIVEFNIHILKGKIILFEEEDTNLKESVDGLED